MSNKLYKNQSIVLTTKHCKEEAIEPLSKEHLGAKILVLSVDTDKLGTFSGEVEREGTAQEIVKKKAEWGMNLSGSDYGMATEGSFGPHPAMPFCASGHEIIHFIDKKRGFELQLSELTLNTNYNSCTTDSIEKLLSFAKDIRFPSHGLILRPNIKKDEDILFKGVCKNEVLLDTFEVCRKNSLDGQVFVQTDMRAHMNPTRMKVISGLMLSLTKRLVNLCPECQCPGWGLVQIVTGLECKNCYNPTDLEMAKIFGCAKCDHKIRVPANLSHADPVNCIFCNP